MKYIVWLLLLLLITVNAYAEGSVFFEKDIVPILKTRPEFYRFIIANFKLSDDPYGIRISNEASPALGGARIGPYTVGATWHSPKGDVPIKLIINTKIKFYNKKGREIDDIKRAVRYTETLDSIELEPPNRD